MPTPRLHAKALLDRAKEVGDETESAIACRLQVEQSTVSRLLAERTTPSLRTLVAMRAAYGISLDELVPAETPTVEEPAQAGAAAS